MANLSNHSAIDLVAERAEKDGDRPAIVHGDQVITYAALAASARCAGAALRSSRIERFAAVFDSPVALIKQLLGASGVGVEACAYPNTLPIDEINELTAAFDHQVLVTDRIGMPGASATVICHADLGDTAAGGRASAGSAAPLLVLTTGTTGRPKAARHDWRRLIDAGARWSSPPTSRWLLTYGLHQFAGQQVLLHVLGSGATLVIPENNQPRHALRAMETAGVTHVSATPTFWRILIGLLSDRASSLPLEQITIGGEAVPDDLPKKLRAVFPGAKLSQVYASTEFGSGVATGADEGGLPLSVLERGPDALVQFSIVDGELHTRSRAGMISYYDGDDVDDAWRPTGDLVEVRGDRLRFLGRTVDVVNVGGVKVHPLAIEERALSVPGVRFAHAHGRANPVTGQIVVLEVVASGDGNEDELAAVEAAIRDECSDLPGAARPHRIRFVESIDVHGQKIRRAGGTS